MASDTLCSARLAVQQADTGLDTNAWMVPLNDRGRIIVGGRHRARFLHNFTTCQVKELPVDTARWGAVTNEHGGVVAITLVEARENELVCEVDLTLRDEVIAHLTRYRIADQVTFAADDAFCLVSVCGPAAQSVFDGLGLPWPAEQGQTADAEIGGVQVRLTRNDYRWNVSGVDVSIPVESRALVADAIVEAGAEVATPMRVRHHRVAHGIPADRIDVDPETTPLEVAYLRPIVDWNKGCYLGQEVICMMEDLGKPRKQLTEVVVVGATDAQAMELSTSKGKVVGRLTTTVTVNDRVYGLAALKRKHAKPGTAVHVGADAVATVLGLAGDTRETG